MCKPQTIGVDPLGLLHTKCMRLDWDWLLMIYVAVASVTISVMRLSLPRETRDANATQGSVPMEI